MFLNRGEHKLEKVIKALNDPVRRQILQILKKKSCSVGEILEELDITGATLSYHLQVLRKADLVLCERKGNTIIYQINTSVMEDMINWLLKLTRKEGKDE